MSTAKDDGIEKEQNVIKKLMNHIILNILPKSKCTIKGIEYIFLLILIYNKVITIQKYLNVTEMNVHFVAFLELQS